MSNVTLSSSEYYSEPPSTSFISEQEVSSSPSPMPTEMQLYLVRRAAYIYCCINRPTLELIHLPPGLNAEARTAMTVAWIRAIEIELCQISMLASSNVFLACENLDMLSLNLGMSVVGGLF
jgi:hypothetical protein